MANKDRLRENRYGTIINTKSKKEDKLCIQVINVLKAELESKFKCNIKWIKKIYLIDIIEKLSGIYKNVDFCELESEGSFMTPDGGITFIVDKYNRYFPILIFEVKNQGTNDIRLQEGKTKQAQGNAVERLGKNVIGFRTYMLDEAIFPFVCFGDGCDFKQGSTILDRVKTIAMFGSLNKDYTSNIGINGIFNRGSYYFRDAKWTYDEMFNIVSDVAERSIYYYFSKYGKNTFII